MKKEYIKPDIEVVQLQHMTPLLAGSNLNSISTTGLAAEDAIIIDDDEAGDGFWGR